MSVLFPAPLEPTSAVVVPGGVVNDTSRSTGTPGDVLEADVLERDVARRPRAIGVALLVLLILRRRLPDLADAIEPGERLAHLRPDRRDLHQRRRHQPDEEDVHDEIAERHRAADDRASADDDHEHADHADDHRRRGADRRRPGDRRRDVLEQPLDPVARRSAPRAPPPCRPSRSESRLTPRRAGP